MSQHSTIRFRTLLLALLSAMLLTSYAVAATPHDDSTTAEDYSGYFDNILKIEEAIVREDFAESLRLYLQTFAQYERAFACDAYNACQISAMMRHPQFDLFFQRSAGSGVPLALLLRSPYIAAAYNADSARLHQLFMQEHEAYLHRIDTSLRNEFAQRFDIEQKNKGGDRYRAICTDNFNRIAELGRQGRFPGEAIIGPDDELANSHVLATLLHYPYAYTALDSILWKAVRSGAARPLMVLYLYSFNQTRTSILYDKSMPADTEHFAICYNIAFGKRSNDLAEVNRQRRLRQVYSIEVEDALPAVARKHRIDYRLGY